MRCILSARILNLFRLVDDLPILNVVENLGGYDLAIVMEIQVTMGMLYVLKKPVAKKEQAFAREVAAV